MKKIGIGIFMAFIVLGLTTQVLAHSFVDENNDKICDHKNHMVHSKKEDCTKQPKDKQYHNYHHAENDNHQQKQHQHKNGCN